MHLDRDLGIDSRHHVADEVGEGLLDLDRHPRDLAAEIREQFFDDLLAVSAAFGIDADDVFASVHRRRMLVHLGPSRAADEVEDLTIRALLGLLECPQLRVDQSRRLVRGMK